MLNIGVKRTFSEIAANWQKFLVAVLFGTFPVLNFFAYGYIAEASNQKSWPNWGNWKRLFFNGAKITLLAFIYFLPSTVFGAFALSFPESDIATLVALLALLMIIANSLFFLAAFAVFCKTLSFRKALDLKQNLEIVKSESYLNFWARFFVATFGLFFIAWLLPLPFDILYTIAGLTSFLIIGFGKERFLGTPLRKASKPQLRQPKVVAKAKKPAAKKSMKGFAFLMIFLLLLVPFAAAHVDPKKGPDLYNVKILWTGGTLFDDGDYAGAGEITVDFATEEQEHSHGMERLKTGTMSVNSGERFRLGSPVLIYSHDQCHPIDSPSRVCFSISDIDDDPFIQQTKEAVTWLLSETIQLLVGEFTPVGQVLLVGKLSKRLTDGLGVYLPWIAELSIGKKAVFDDVINRAVNAGVDYTVGTASTAAGQYVEGAGGFIKAVWEASPDKILATISDAVSAAIVNFFYQYVVGTGADDLGFGCAPVHIGDSGGSASVDMQNSATLTFKGVQTVIEKDSSKCKREESKTVLCSRLGTVKEYLPGDVCSDDCDLHLTGFICNPDTCTCKEGKGPECGDGKLWKAPPSFKSKHRDEDCDPGSPATAKCPEGEICVNCECRKSCGNGKVDAGEGCDPPGSKCPAVNGFVPICSKECQCDMCGNKQIDDGEDCDESSPATAVCPEGQKCRNCKCEEPCGNGYMDRGEECDPGDALTADCPMQENFLAYCSQDCRCIKRCGDGYLEPEEMCDPGSPDTADNCFEDLGYYCENCQCLPRCGNGKVDSGENCMTCPEDVQCPLNMACIEGACVPVGQTCGNYKIEEGEDCSNCPRDVKCPAGYYCDRGTCRSKVDSTIIYEPMRCGNKKVDSGENCSNCSADVKCLEGQTCIEGVCTGSSAVILGSGSDNENDFVKCNPETSIDSATHIDIVSHYVIKEGSDLRFVMSVKGNIPQTTSTTVTFIQALSDNQMSFSYPDQIMQQKKYGVVAVGTPSGWGGYLARASDGAVIQGGIKDISVSGNTIEYVVPLDKIGSPSQLHIVSYTSLGGKGCDTLPNSSSAMVSIN